MIIHHELQSSHFLVTINACLPYLYNFIMKTIYIIVPLVTKGTWQFTPVEGDMCLIS